MKINITVNDELLAQIDKKSDEMFMSRSGFIALACTEKLQSMQAVEMLEQMTSAFKTIAVKGTVDDEVVQQLDLLQATYNAIYGNR